MPQTALETVIPQTPKHGYVIHVNPKTWVCHSEVLLFQRKVCMKVQENILILNIRSCPLNSYQS